MARSSKNKTALITGGAKRIGKALSLFLAESGYDIALTYNRSHKSADAVKQKVQKLGQTCNTYQCDLNSDEDFTNLIPNIRKDFKKLDVIIHNASTFEPSQFQTSSLKQFDSNFNIHVRAPLQITRDYARLYKKGLVITILDTHITDNTSRHFDYLLSKKTLHEFTKMAAVALAPDIRVNGIAPGLILPPEDAKFGHLERLAKDIPLKRKGSIKNILQSVQFLIENTYLTGQILFNDGGENLL